MGLFLPVLLLGLTQPAELPVTAQPQAVSQADANAGSSSIPARQFTLRDRKFRQLENFDHIQVTGDTDGNSPSA
jgi:hypothetical protein